MKTFFQIRWLYILSGWITLCLLSSCHEIETYDNDNLGNFDALWNFVDRHYCFFEHKGIDWNAVGDKYRPMAQRCGDQRALFSVMAQMLDELEDGHVNLSSWFDTSYYRKWWSDYPENYNERVVQQYYLNFDYSTVGNVYYGILSGHNVGYIRIPTFTVAMGEGNLDAILDYFRTCNGIIIDVRSNGGGEIVNVETYIRRFIDRTIVAGYMVHKDGPGHDDFAEPYEYSYSPAIGRVMWFKPIVVLTNRSTFSSANNFVSIMKDLPQVKIVGDTTGGGSGMPLSSELPNGWGIRISACRILDAQRRDTEFGIAPTEGWKVNLNEELALIGIDTMLESAMMAIVGNE